MNKPFLISLLAAVLLTTVSPSVAEQTSGIPKIGFLSPQAGREEGEQAFQRGLRELGFIEGQSIAVEWRFANGKAEILPQLANELVHLKVDVIVVGGRQAALAAKNATQKIPTVIAAAGDPVATGLVASLAHPGGNLTGLSIDAPGLNGKRLEILKESFPRLARAAVLYQPLVPGWELNLAETEHSARLLKIQLHPITVNLDEPNELDHAFSMMIRERDEGVLKLPAAELPSYRKRIIELAAQNRLPTVYDDKQITAVGGLMSYGTNVPIFTGAQRPLSIKS